MSTKFTKLKLNNKERVIALYVARIFTNIDGKYLRNKYDFFTQDSINLFGYFFELSKGENRKSSYIMEESIESFSQKNEVIELAKKVVKQSQNKQTIYCDIMENNLLKLQNSLDLSMVDLKILRFLCIAKDSETMEDFIDNFETIDTNKIIKIIANALELKQNLVEKSINKSSKLITTGLLDVEFGERYKFSSKFEFAYGLVDYIFMQNNSILDIFNEVFYKSKPSNLSLNNFNYLKNHNENITKFLQNNKKSPLNVLIYGKPGTGKTEWVKALNAKNNKILFDIANIDGNNSLTNKSRLQAYKTADCILGKQDNYAILFDEAESIFNNKNTFFTSARESTTKIWLNQLLENATTPTFWITNSVEDIDDAYLRRFDYVFEMKVPPKTVRYKIIKNAFGDEKISDDFVKLLAENKNITPANITKSIDFVKKTNQKNIEQEVLELINNKFIAQNKTKISLRSKPDYDLSIINTDINLQKLVANVGKSKQLRLCLYGEPGTGKTEFGNYLSGQLNSPFILKKASDLMGKYVGETEKNLALAFEEANDENAILQIDEADSFLRDRNLSKNSWETTQVNELLTQMENYEGVFIASTNLLQNIDKAAMRRFDIKAEFKPLKIEQSMKFFSQILSKNNVEIADKKRTKKELKNLNLTPGDFATSLRKIKILGEKITTDLLIDFLKDECSFKGVEVRKIGFV